MDQSEATARLTALTGTFRPAGSATFADLTAARAAVAASLLHNPADLSAPAGDLRLAPARADAGLSALVGQAAAAAGPVPLAFRRSVPFQSVTNPDAVPSATAGMASETLGPFADANGQLHWVDIFFPIRQTWISRPGAATPFLILPLALPFPVPTTLSLGAGSVWIASQLLAPSAPADGYTGLTISGGTITFTAVPTEVSGNLEVAAGETVALTIKLNAPPGPIGGTGLGTDGGAVAAAFPAEVSFSFSPAGGSITAAADATLTAYGQTIAMQWHAATPVYEPPLNQILVDFTPDTTSFTVGAAASPLFSPQGTAPVTAAAWALPVATAAPAQLGAAAGDGALAVLLGPGLNASWQGLSGGPAPLAGTFVSGAAGLLELITTIGRNLQLAETIALWPETPQATRRSSLDLGFPQTSPLFFVSVASAGTVKQTEAVACATVITAHLDRPLGADGSRLGPTLPGSLLVFETTVASGVVLTGQSPHALPLPAPIAIALTNALVITMPAQSLLLVAGFTASVTELISGSLLLGFPFLRLLPTLPDPYAANFLPGRTRPVPRQTSDALIADVNWTPKGGPQLALGLTAPASSAMLPTEAAAPEGAAPNAAAPNPADQDQAWVRALSDLFHETIGAEPATLFLLDVSSNADQFGVGIAPVSGTLAPGGAALGITGLQLVAPGANLRVFTVPQVQWEPVVNIPNRDAPFPSPMAFLDDGGPTLLGSNDVTLVPVAPAPVLDQLIAAYEAGEVTAAALFTLPFGMRAAAALPKRSLAPHPVPIRPPGLAAIRPGFAQQNLTGGRQVSLTAGRFAVPGGASPSLPGATVQLRNLVDRTGNPGFPGHSPPPTPPLSILGPGVDGIFNTELAPGGSSPFVPVTRIDFSGYGESAFSAWADPSASASPPSVVQAQFNVMLGRTSHEVVQVKTTLYPCGAIVIRTVTIERQDNGEVTRYDSGWIPITPGTFHLPGGVVVHPGVVTGYFNIREIRDTSQVYTAAGGIELRAVYFDADIQIENVTSGARNGLVPGTGLLGFVQTGGPTLGPADLAALIDKEGAPGGPVDCVIAVGGSQQPMRLARVEVGTARPGGSISAPQFAAVARGSLTLPVQGNWSVVRLADTVSEPQAIDPDLGLPLIRQGAAGTTSSAPYRFAEAADLLTPDTPSVDFTLLHATSATRVLFPRPKIETGASAFTSTVTPLLADGFALMEAVGIAPRQDTCLALPNANYQLQIGGPGVLTLDFSPNPFPPSRQGRTLATGAAATIGLEYADQNGKPCNVDVAISPSSWSIGLTGLNVRLDMGPFSALLRTVGDMLADGSSGTSFANPNLVLGSVLQPLGDILTFLESLGLPDPFAVAFSNSGWQETKKYKLKAGLQLKLPMKKSEGAPFDIPTDTPFGEFDITLKVGYGNVASSEDALFTASSQWLAYLSFQGSLQVPVFPAVKVGGTLIFKMEADFPTGTKPAAEKLTFQLGVIITAGGDLVPGVVQLKASVAFAVTLVVVTSTPSSVGIGVGLILQASGQIMSGLVGITFTAEADGLYIDSPKEIQATFDIQVDVSLCWFLNVTFETQTQYTKTLS